MLRATVGATIGAWPPAVLRTAGSVADAALQLSQGSLGGHKMKPKIFVSVGSAGTPLHLQASEAIFRALDTAGLSPRQMDKNEWSSEQPLRAIKRVIEDCDGAAVIAFSRYHFTTGSELGRGGIEQPLTDVRLPTVWNQIEAAMAYANGIPLLVIAEHGLRDDGLLEGRYDWKVYWTDFKPEQLQSDAFLGYLESWKRLVFEGRASRVQDAATGDSDISKLTIAQLFTRLSLPQVWSALSAIVGLLIGVATIAFRAGSGKWPWQ